MSSQIRLWAGLIGIGATITLVQQVAVAKSSSEVGETAKAITVLITQPNKPDDFGSGVILQRQGDIYTVLTAAHVVRNKTSYKITTPDDRKYDIISSSIRSSPGNIDLAVVKFKSTTKYPTAKLGNCNLLKSGMDLYVGGFPRTSRAINKAIFVFREGKVSANSDKVLENGYSLIYSNSTLPGMSGGAVLNSEGELVAIHGRGDKDDSGAKTGFNLGIPINRFATVASKMGVELSEKVAAIPQNTAPKADDYIALGVQKHRKGNYRGSLADYNRAIQLDPKSASAYHNRGFLKYDKLNDSQGALADFNRAIQLNPKLALAYKSRSVLKYAQLKDSQGALADINRAIQLAPNVADPYYLRGTIRESELLDFEGALADYNRAISIDPSQAEAYHIRGGLKQRSLKDFQGALADYNRAISIDSNYAAAYTTRGSLKALELQDFEGALADYNRAIQLDSKSAANYFFRGALKEKKLQDFQGALADYNRAISLDPSYAVAYNNRGFLKHDRLNDKSGGIVDMQRAAKLYQQQGKTKSYQEAIYVLKEWQ